MVETLKRRSALARVYVKGRFGADTKVPGITISARADMTLVHVDGADIDTENVRRFKLPAAGQSTADGGTRTLWMGPGRWLMTSGDGALAQKVTAGMPTAAVNDVSSSRTVLRLTGAKVRDVLAAGCPIDLHPTKWTAGMCATTILDHFTVTIDCVDADSFDVYVARGFAQSFFAWLMDAAAEFGVEVV